MLRRQTRKSLIKLRDEKYIDSRAPHELDLLVERTNQPGRAIRCEEMDRMRPESHCNRLGAKLTRTFYDSLQDFAMSEVQAIKVADAYDRRMRDICIGQCCDFHPRMNVAQPI